MVAKVATQTFAMRCDSNISNQLKCGKPVLILLSLRILDGFFQVPCIAMISIAIPIGAIFTLVSCDSSLYRGLPDSAQTDESNKQTIENANVNKSSRILQHRGVNKNNVQESSSIKNEIDTESFGKSWKLMLGDVSIQGNTSKKDVIRDISIHIRDIRSCYRKEVLQKSGHIVVWFRISTDGTVIESSIIGASIENIQVIECIQHTVPKWRFPPSKNNDVFLVTATILHKVL